MTFPSSLAAQSFLETAHHPLGAPFKHLLARSAVFLALDQNIPPDFTPPDFLGKQLDDQEIIESELYDLVRARFNQRAGTTLDEAAYRDSFSLHFEFGCQRLRVIWEQSGENLTRFLCALLTLSSDNFAADASMARFDSMPVVDKEVTLQVLANAPGWSLNGPGTSNGLLVISGQPGSGKSQLALDLLAQLASQNVRFLFFDLRGELENTPNHTRQQNTRNRFLEQTGAQYVRLIRERLPINPLYRDPDPTINAQIAYEIANLVRCFAPQLGPRQEHKLFDAYQWLEAPDFPSLFSALQHTENPGVDLAIIEKIARLNLFASAQTAIDPETWLSNSLVIDFKELGNDSETKALSAALLLNFLMKKLGRTVAITQGIQPLKMVLFVDEAHLLLPKEGKAGLLGSLARQGRAWGVPVWLASQDADAFITFGANATNFAELAECGLHFSPQTLTDTQQRMILGGLIPRKLKKGEAGLRLQANLFTGPARQFWKDGGIARSASPLPAILGEGSRVRGDSGDGLAVRANSPLPNLHSSIEAGTAESQPTTPEHPQQEFLQALVELGRIVQDANPDPPQPPASGLPIHLPPPNNPANPDENDETKSAA